MKWAMPTRLQTTSPTLLSSIGLQPNTLHIFSFTSLHGRSTPAKIWTSVHCCVSEAQCIALQHSRHSRYYMKFLQKKNSDLCTLKRMAYLQPYCFILPCQTWRQNKIFFSMPWRRYRLTKLLGKMGISLFNTKFLWLTRSQSEGHREPSRTLPLGSLRNKRSFLFLLLGCLLRTHIRNGAVCNNKVSSF